jgi:transposase
MMRAYSEDLRKKIVAAIERDVPKAQAARLFDVSLSSAKRYTRTALRGDPLMPRKSPGRPRKVDGKATVLLEKDVQEHPTATISQRRRSLEHITGTHLSDVTVRRLMKRLGFSQKTERGGGGTRRMATGGLEGDGRPNARRPHLGFRGRDGHEHLPLSSLRVVQEGREGALLSAS